MCQKFNVLNDSSGSCLILGAVSVGHGEVSHSFVVEGYCGDGIKGVLVLVLFQVRYPVCFRMYYVTVLHGFVESKSLKLTSTFEERVKRTTH